MWDGCNSEVSKAIRPSFKDYEESQRNETAIKFGALNPAINKPGEKYTTHRMGEDFFGVMADENRWFYVTKSVPKHNFGTNTRRVGFICSSHISFLFLLHIRRFQEYFNHLNILISSSTLQFLQF